ncbi:MAG: DUF4097 family beta strand repeat protein [Gemmatimonadetes bacterium]|nr:DUF4097 family beta strand repeat protein [Gemmatimonadota bacterium]
MTGVNRAAVVMGIVLAGALTLGQARDGDAMTNGLVWGSQKAVQGAQWVVAGVGRTISGFFNEGGASGASVPASAQRRDRDESDQEGTDFVWRGAVGAGQTVEIKGMNGDIIAERATGGQIEVRAEKRARRSDPEAVRIEVVEHAGGVTVCAVYPSSRGRENTCEPGSGGRNRTRNNDVRVTFYVSVPEDVGFLGKTVNGDVRVHDLASDVDARSVNGDIEISTTGFAKASTVNGSIAAAMERYDMESGLSFSTVNGSISLDLPDDVDADVDAKWVNGRLETDLPLELIGRASRRSVRGFLGDGGPELNLRTVNGSIHLF